MIILIINTLLFKYCNPDLQDKIMTEGAQKFGTRET